MPLTQKVLAELRERLARMVSDESMHSRSRVADIVATTTDRRDGGDVFEGAQNEANLAVITVCADEAGLAFRRAQLALRRIGTGEYGVCIVCDHDITIARLRANPTAIRCTRCQELHEMT